MAVEVVSLHAVEILDSRGRPTLSVELGLDGGPTCRAGVPSGASTGSGEAVELRDGDAGRYGGKGTRQAAENVNGPIADAVCGRSFETLVELDRAVMELDGTNDKSRLRANAIIGVSMAAARAFAAAAGAALWRSLTPAGVTPRLPVPHFNVVNGGAHAPNELDFQEFMLAPLGASSYVEAVQAGAEVYAALKARLAAAGHATGLGDEGGFAPQIARPEDVLSELVGAISDAGYEPGRNGVAIALDPAASEFYRDGVYRVAGESLSTSDMVGYYADLVDRFPVWSIEDGLAEDDWGAGRS